MLSPDFPAEASGQERAPAIAIHPAPASVGLSVVCWLPGLAPTLPANRSRIPPSSRLCVLPQLGRSLQDLSSLGFSREQVSAAILRYPTVTQLT